MELSLWAWIGFCSFLAGMLALDLGVFHRKAHVVTFREAMVWSLVWISLALGFSWLLLLRSGPQPAMEFLTGYVIEKSLSVDNVFVFAMIFSAMKVPRYCEHKVLFWGVFGALTMRVILIVAGVALIERFHWLVHLFGAFLLIAAWRMIKGPNLSRPLAEHWVVRSSQRLFRVTDEFHEDRFFIRRDGKLWATPLLLVLILSISKDPFIVFTSNAFAILGLRSLYFALSGLMEKFCYLKYGLAGVLGFVGVKMMLLDIAPIPISVSLMVVASIAMLSIVASLLRRSPEPCTSETPGCLMDWERKGPARPVGGRSM